jgi:hypothetical protein
MAETPTHADILAAIKALGVKVDALAQAVGTEDYDHHGQRIGTGVRGRIMRLELRVDLWRNRIIGALFAGSVLIACVWWLVQDKVGGVLK